MSSIVICNFIELLCSHSLLDVISLNVLVEQQIITQYITIAQPYLIYKIQICTLEDRDCIGLICAFSSQPLKRSLGFKSCAKTYRSNLKNILYQHSENNPLYSYKKKDFRTPFLETTRLNSFKH